MNSTFIQPGADSHGAEKEACPETVHKRIIKDTGFFSFATIFSQIISFIRGLIVPNILGPHYYGLLNGLSVILDHTQYSHIGIANGMMYRIPFYRGKGDKRAVENIRDVAFSVSVVAGTLVAVGLAITTMLLWSRLSQPMRAGMSFFTVLVFIQNMRVFINMTLRADHRFTVLSVISIAESMCGAVIVIGLAIAFGFYGVLMGMCLTGIAAVAASFIYGRYHLRWSFQKKVLQDLMHIGFPLFIVGFAQVFFLGLDRILIAQALGAKHLGMYALGLTMAMQLRVVPIAFVKVLSTRIYEESGKEKGDIGQYFMHPTMCLGLFAISCVGGVSLALPWFFTTFFPRFIPGIPSGQIVILTSYFFIVSLLARQVLVGYRRNWVQLLFTVVVIGFTFFWGRVILAADGGIGGIAGVMLVASALYAGLFLFSAARLIMPRRTQALVFVMKIYALAVYGAGIIYAVQKAARTIFVQPSLISVIVTVGVFLLGCAPLYYMIGRGSWLVQELLMQGTDLWRRVISRRKNI